MIVVSDTSPIANLIVIRQLPLLHQLFNEVIIPEKVHEEIMALGNFSIYMGDYEKAGWIQIKSATDIRMVNRFEETLDAGEAEAIALAKTMHADVLLIDELKGRKVTQQESIRYMGLLGALILAKQKSLISAVKPIVDELIYKADFRISDTLYNKILEKAGE